MFKIFQPYLAVVAGALFLLVSISSLVGIYRVHSRLEQVANLKVDVVKEKVAQEVGTQLDKKIEEVNQQTNESANKLTEILKDAQAQAKGAGVQPAPIVVHVTTPATVSAQPQSVPAPQPVAAAPASPGPSDTTVRAINVLWDDFCAKFPDQPECVGYQSVPSGAMRASAAPQPGGSGELN